MKIKKISITLIILFSFSLIFKIDTVQAVLQTNKNTPTTKARNTWVTQIRQIENVNGGMGLSETQKANLTSNESNNIDIHMQKNTEYGAMAILSASQYGKPNKIQNGETTTGNETGVVIPYRYEWTAAQHTDYYGGPNYAGWNNKYLNYYGSASSYQRKNGDAMLETGGWHGTSSSYQTYGVVGSKHRSAINAPGGIIRNRGSGIFSYGNDAYSVRWSWSSYYGEYEVYQNSNEARLECGYASREVVVNGQGL